MGKEPQIQQNLISERVYLTQKEPIIMQYADKIHANSGINMPQIANTDTPFNNQSLGVC